MTACHSTRNAKQVQLAAVSIVPADQQPIRHQPMSVAKSTRYKELPIATGARLHPAYILKKAIDDLIGIVVAVLCYALDFETKTCTIDGDAREPIHECLAFRRAHAQSR